MPSRVLETVLTGRNLLSPTLTKAAADVEGFDAKVTAASTRASAAADASSKAQATAAERVVAANTRTSASSEAMAAKVRASQAKASESTRAFADVTESSAARSAAAWSSFATKGLPLAAAAVAVVTGKMAADYQTNLVKLETTAGESAKNIGMVGQGMLTMAGQVGVSAQDLSKAMYTVDSAGIHGADSLKVLKAAAEGARQENADLSKVTDAVTTALHDYHLPASQAAKVTSELVTAVSHGKTNFDELTGSLHSVTPLASKLGISLADVTGTLSAMTASGESADQATQNMADTLRHLANPTNTMIAELAQLGISTTDLSNSLSQRGLAGTLQYVSDAIVQHVDPATQKVLLPALNQSKAAAQDLQIMIGKMPAPLAQLSQKLLDGSVSIKDYTKASKDLGGQQGAMALQFLSLMKSSDGFNQVLKAGGPAEQVFEAAMAKAIGTSAGLNVMLQTTGENAGATNAAIKDIASASAQADGNIKGWSEVQHTFNQQLHEAGAEAGAMAIQLGQHVLPAATAVTGWIAHDGLPGLQHLGGAVSDAVHWFMQLPAPVRDSVAVLGALKFIVGTDMFAGFKASARVLAVGFANDMRNMATSARASMAQVKVAFAEAKLAQQELVAGRFGLKSADDLLATSVYARATGDLKGLGAAAGVVAKGGIATLGKGLGGIVNLLGGPWVVGIGAAVFGITELMGAIARHDAEIKKDTADVQKWNEAIALGGDGGTAISAQKHLDDLRQKIAALQSAIDQYNAAAQRGYARGGIGTLVTQQKELQRELDQGTKAWKEQLAGMTPVQVAQERLTLAQQNLNDALKHNPPTSLAVVKAEDDLANAQHQLKLETDGANRSAETQIQRQQDQANTALGVVDAQRQAQEASLALTQQVSDYNSQIADGTLKGTALQQATLGIVDAAEQAAKAAGDAAAKQAAQNGATDTGAASQAAFMKTLQDFDSTLTGPAKKAMDDYIAQLGGQQTQAQLTAGAINGIGVQVTNLPNSHMIEINVPTDQQMQKLHDLGYATVTLPDGHVVVTADTNPAITEIQDLLNYARQQSINYRANLAITNPLPGTSQRMGTYAAGGWTGPGGKYTPVGVVHADEFVFTKEQTQKAGGPGAMYALAASIDRGFANGGWANVPPGGFYAGSAAVPVRLDPGSYKSDLTGYLASLASPYAGMVPGATSQAAVQLGARMAAAVGWLGPEFMALVKLWTRESGWNPYAVNPSSGAYGIPQALGHGHVYNLGDSAAQIAWGLSYIRSRYGDPINAWAHEMAVGWYRDGTNYVPSDQLAVLHRGEAVIPADRNQGAPYRSPASFPGYGSPFSGGGGIDYDRLAEAITRARGGNQYTAQVTNTGQPITAHKLLSTFRELEWLGGDT